MAGLRSFAAILAILLTAAAEPVGSESEVRFDRYDPLSRNVTLAQRLLPPLAVDLAFRDLAARHQSLAEQPVDLAQERFKLFVPTVQPAGGYGLLVFVPPWQGAEIPPAWKRALARRGIIMVTAARSGNEEPVTGRRAPLALLAAINVIQRFPVDKSRVYVGGFSGGSKVAFKLAVGYPDLFKGALLLAGADALGEDGFATPSAQLLGQLGEQSRIVFVTGTRDEINIDLSRSAAISLRRFCAQASGLLQVPALGHTLIDQSWLGKALDLLEAAPNKPASDRARCLADLDARIASELTEVEAQIDQGRRVEARKRLLAIDARYGGLALPRSLALLRRIEASERAITLAFHPLRA